MRFLVSVEGCLAAKAHPVTVSEHLVHKASEGFWKRENRHRFVHETFKILDSNEIFLQPFEFNQISATHLLIYAPWQHYEVDTAMFRCLHSG